MSSPQLISNILRVNSFVGLNRELIGRQHVVSSTHLHDQEGEGGRERLVNRGRRAAKERGRGIGKEREKEYVSLPDREDEDEDEERERLGR